MKRYLLFAWMENKAGGGMNDLITDCDYIDGVRQLIADLFHNWDRIEIYDIENKKNVLWFRTSAGTIEVIEV